MQRRPRPARRLRITWVYNATIPHQSPSQEEVPPLRVLPAPPYRGRRIPATHKHSFLKWRPLHGGRVKEPSGTRIPHHRPSHPHVCLHQLHASCPLGPRLGGPSPKSEPGQGHVVSSQWNLGGTQKVEGLRGDFWILHLGARLGEPSWVGKQPGSGLSVCLLCSFLLFLGRCYTHLLPPR